MSNSSNVLQGTLLNTRKIQLITSRLRALQKVVDVAANLGLAPDSGADTGAETGVEADTGAEIDTRLILADTGAGAGAGYIEAEKDIIEASFDAPSNAFPAPAIEATSDATIDFHFPELP